MPRDSFMHYIKRRKVFKAHESPMLSRFIDINPMGWSHGVVMWIGPRSPILFRNMRPGQVRSGQVGQVG